MRKQRTNEIPNSVLRNKNKNTQSDEHKKKISWRAKSKNLPVLFDFSKNQKQGGGAFLKNHGQINPSGQ